MIAFLKLLIIFVILLMIPTHAFGLDNGYARIVYNVSGLQDYQLHWNDRFPPGSTLNIYAEADGINHRRAVGVDYVFIIRDSNNNIVNTKVFENRLKSYKENDFVTYTQDINEDWEDGAYVAEIHIFDLLNDSIMDKHYQNVSETLLNGEKVCHENDNNNDNNDNDNNDCDGVKNEEPDIPYMDRSDIRNSKELMDRQYKLIIEHFYIDRYANKYPANRFIVDKISLDRETIAPGEPIQVNISIKNTFYDSGSVSIDLILDNKSINNYINNNVNTDTNSLILDIEPYSSKDIVLTIPSEKTQFLDYGKHLLEIETNTSNTAIFDSQKSFIVSETEIEIPARFYYKDIQTDKLIINSSETLNITVTTENKGREGTNNIGLLINNVLTEKKNVHLNFLETKDINFTFTGKEPGEYKISINGTNISKMFFVGTGGEIQQPGNITEGKSEERRTIEERRMSSAIIISGLSILVILIYIIRKKIISKGLK